jgi:hypothetical protein
LGGREREVEEPPNKEEGDSPLVLDAPTEAESREHETTATATAAPTATATATATPTATATTPTTATTTTPRAESRVHKETADENPLPAKSKKVVKKVEKKVAKKEEKKVVKKEEKKREKYSERIQASTDDWVRLCFPSQLEHMLRFNSQFFLDWLAQRSYAFLGICMELKIVGIAQNKTEELAEESAWRRSQSEPC